MDAACRIRYNSIMPWDLIGHGWAEELLRSHIARDQVRHAYLFAGPAAVGKRTLALRFAQALVCERGGGTGDVCEQTEMACRGCRLIPTESHPDLHRFPPPDEPGALRVDQVRELQRHLALAPYESRWRIALLPDFQDASHSAANALLKTLEEPPPAVVLLLTAPRVEMLLPTVASRCEVLALRALPVEALAEALVARGLAKDRARTLASLAGGRPGAALALAGDEEALDRRTRWLEDLRALLSTDRRQRFAYIERMLARKDLNTKRRVCADALETWLGLWRDAMLLAHEADGRIGNPDRSEDLQWLVGVLGGNQITAAALDTQATLDALGKSVNPQLALETLMLDWPRVRE